MLSRRPLGIECGFVRLSSELPGLWPVGVELEEVTSKRNVFKDETVIRLPSVGTQCPVREWLRSCELHRGSFIDPCGLGTLMPEEETESPEEVRSQRRRSLPNVDE